MDKSELLSEQESAELLIDSLLSLPEEEIITAWVERQVQDLTQEKQILSHSVIRMEALKASFAHLQREVLLSFVADPIFDIESGMAWLDRGRKVQVWPQRE